jgi:hypothetical protein
VAALLPASTPIEARTRRLVEAGNRPRGDGSMRKSLNNINKIKKVGYPTFTSQKNVQMLGGTLKVPVLLDDFRNQPLPSGLPANQNFLRT